MSNIQDEYQTGSQDSANYAKGYKIFLKRTNFREKIEEQVRRHIRSKPMSFNQPSLRIIDIGCGNGEMTRRYINAINETHPTTSLKLTLVEPAQDALKEAVSNLGDFKIDFYQSTLETFLENSTAEFDWIIASHIFYHVDTKVISKLLNFLSTDGVLMITMGAPEHPLKKEEPFKSFAKHGDSSEILSTLSALRDEGIADFEVETVATDLNLKELWKRDSTLTSDGLSYFSFTFNRNVEKLSGDDQIAFTGLLQSIEDQGHIVHPKHDVFWISRKRKA